MAARFALLSRLNSQHSGGYELVICKWAGMKHEVNTLELRMNYASHPYFMRISSVIPSRKQQGSFIIKTTHYDTSPYRADLIEPWQMKIKLV